MNKYLILLFLVQIISCCAHEPKRSTSSINPTRSTSHAQENWEVYNGLGGRKFSPLRQITPLNANQLELAWQYTVGLPAAGTKSPYAFVEQSPLIVDGRMYMCTGQGKIISVDAENGQELWAFDPKVKAGYIICRGLSYWIDHSTPSDSACHERIVSTTFDGRLIALDAKSSAPNGVLCAEFGSRGIVDLKTGMGETKPDELYYTSPPLVYSEYSANDKDYDAEKDLLVVGGSILDDLRESPLPPSGVIRAFSAKTGKLVWAFNTILPKYKSKFALEAKPDDVYVRGTPNMWSVMVADPKRHLIYAPLGNATPDHFVGSRRKSGRTDLSSSLVAINTQTGQYHAHFKTVEDDIWDYDIAAQPLLTKIPVNGDFKEVVMVFTKGGMIFVLDRDTLKPVIPIRYMSSKWQSSVPEEIVARKQPFSTFPPPMDISNEVALRDKHLDFVRSEMGEKGDPAVKYCKDLMWDGNADINGRFQPATLKGGLEAPGPIGGHHWGGGSYDEKNALLITNIQHVPNIFKLYLEASPECVAVRAGKDPTRGRMFNMDGSRYCLERKETIIPGSSGLECIAPPYGELLAYDFKTRTQKYKIPFGLTGPHADILGAANVGGGIQTAGGVLFIAATADKMMRAIDSGTGQELWRYQMEANGNATPVTYEVNGRQFVAVASGLHFRTMLSTANTATYQERVYVFKLKD